MFSHSTRTPPNPTDNNDVHRIKNSRKKNKNSRRCSFLTISNRNSVIVIDKAIHGHSTSVITSETVGESDYESNWKCSSHVSFPYYRSWRNDRNGDMVLVKDACVSCSILTPEKLANYENKATKQDTPLENKLLKRLKSEYNDLSGITKKISSYTKDILTGISRKTNKKNSKTKIEIISDSRLLATMQPVAMQYFDKSGQPCLKLRLREESGASLFDRNFNSAATERSVNSTQNIEEEIQTIFPEQCPPTDTDSSMYSSSSIYDYLMYPVKKISNTRKIVAQKSL